MKKNDRHTHPPFTFLRNLLTIDEIGDVDGCFEELYSQMACEKGTGYARRWILKQALKSLPGFFSHLVYSKLLMLKNNFTVTLRSAVKNKGLFLIKVSGLAAGIACSLVVILYVTNELSYDTYHPNFDRIYRIGNHRATRIGEMSSASTPAPLAVGLRQLDGVVEKVARVIPPYENAKNVLVVQGDKRFYEKRVFFVDAELFSIFRIPFIAGSPRTALARPRTIVLSESVARKYFGKRPALGRTLAVEIDYDIGASVIEDFEVTGIVADPPDSTHLKYGLLVSLPTFQAHVPDLDSNWGEYHYKYTYVKLRANVSPAMFIRQLQPFSKQVREVFEKRAGFPMRMQEFFLQPLSSLHMKSNFNDEIEPPGNMFYVYIYSIAALLILLIGAINFINLSATLASTRSREVGIRKVLGGSRGDLIFQFLGESLAITFLAFAAAFPFLSALLAYFNRMAGTSISLKTLGQPQVVLSMVALFFLVSLCAGLYPALLLSRFRPTSVRSDSLLPGTKRNGIQHLLIMSQFMICIFLVVCTLVVFRQLVYMKGKALGFSRQQKVIIEVKSKLDYFRHNYEAVKRDFLATPGISGATVSSSVPGEPFNGGYYLQKGSSFNASGAKRLKVLTVDQDFIRAYGIPMTSGRAFRKAGGNDAEAAYIVNAAGARELGLTPQSALGTTWTSHYHRKSKTIVGVTDDFLFMGVKSSADPIVLDIEKSLLRVITLSLDARDMPRALAGAQAAWRRHFPGVPFEYAFLDELFGSVYLYEERMGGLLGMVSLLGIAIAFLGLYGMVSFYARQRRKEIAIRRVVGASTLAIAFLMSRQFVTSVILAGITAVPLAWIATSRWLQDFAYRIQPGFAVFAFAFVAAFLIAMFAVVLQSLRAATDNPVDSLRSE